MTNFKLYNNEEELITNTILDEVLDTTLGDIFGFMETINYLEKERKISFTKEMDRDDEIATLFRLCMKTYLEGECEYSFSEFSEEWLQDMDASFQSPVNITETCPNCGMEINMEVTNTTEKIPFCPYCGQKDVFLCSRCMEENGGDCRPQDKNAFCHGNPHLNK